VLTDGKVAGMGGEVALRVARATCPGAPRFCLTGSVTPEKTALMRAAGADGCLSKREMAAVRATIRQTLEARDSARRPSRP